MGPARLVFTNSMNLEAGGQLKIACCGRDPPARKTHIPGMFRVTVLSTRLTVTASFNFNYRLPLDDAEGRGV